MNQFSIKNTLYQTTRLFAFVVLILFIFTSESKASHIIGGEMNYTCLGSDQYEITLTVYRDCFYADPLAVFDDPAAIGIFNSNGGLIDSLMLPLMNNDTLTPILSDSCLFVPGDVCVHTTTYRRVVSLPFTQGGYNFAYQRCCRNQTITNIVDPTNTGATFQAILTEEAILECNSGAEFRDWPPLFICVNEPISFDHSATDIDGDSLVYSLCTPLQGGDFINNQPQPPLPPPYDEVVWAAPYDVNNLLGGDALTIDSNTGLLTGTPNTIGQFVVGVCIEEYRDGELIATNRRDFQYNVGSCLAVNPIVGNPLAQCEDLTVDFINVSTNADDFLWMFGDPNHPDSTSTAFEPTYTYPDTGFYDITLIAEPSSACSDTLVQTIYLKESTLTPQFNYLVLDCVDSLIVAASNTSFDSFSEIGSYSWTLSDGQTSTEENPTFSITDLDELTLTLVASAVDGCSETFSETFDASILDNDAIVDTLTICPNASVSINNNPFTSANITYEWSPAATLNNPNSPNPVATPSETTIYEVAITDTLNNCTGGFRVMVQIQENGGQILTPDTTYCSEDFTIVSDSNAVISLNWSTEGNFQTVFDADTEITVSESGSNTYYLAAIDELGCSFLDSITVVGGTINLDLNTPDVACVGDQINIGFENTDLLDEIEFSWITDTNIADPTSQNTTIDLPVAGEQPYTLNVSNQFGCEEDIVTDLFVLTDTAPTGFDIVQDCEGFDLTFTNPHLNADFYQWDFGDGIGSGTGATASYTYGIPGTYLVTLSPIEGLPCELDDFQMEIQIPYQVANPAFDVEIVSCGDSATLTFIDATQALQGNVVGWLWDFGNGITSTDQNPTIDFPIDNVDGLNLMVTTDEGCTAQAQLPFDLSNYIINTDALQANQFRCSADPFGLYPDGNPSLTYQWEPVDAVNDPTLANPLSTATEATLYSVTITNFNGCQVEREVSFDREEDLLNADFEWNYTECVDLAALDFEAFSTYSGSDIVSYEWSYGSDSTATGTTFSTSLDMSEEVEVTLVVTAADGCTATNTQLVDFSILELDIPETMILCFGETTTLNTNGNVNYEYTWTPSTGLNNPNSPMPTINLIDTTTYVVSIFDPNTGCGTEQTVTFEVSEGLEDPEFTTQSIECQDGLTVEFIGGTIYGNSEIVAWDWVFSDGTTSNEQTVSISFDEAQSFNADLVVTTVDGCEFDLAQVVEYDVELIDIDFMTPTVQTCANEPVALNPNGNSSFLYQWSPATDLTNPNAMNPSASPSETTEYTVTITAFNGINNCEIIETVTVEVETVDLDFLPGTVVACEAQSVNLNDNAQGNLTYNWNPSNTLDDGTAINPLATITENTIYNVTITNLDGLGICEYTDSVAVVIADLPELNIDDSDPICEEEATLTALTNPTNDIIWSDNSDFSTILGTEIEQEVMTSQEATTYYVQAIGSNGCENIDSISVVNLGVDIDIINSEITCVGDTFILEAMNLDLLDELTYEWQPSSLVIEGQGTPMAAITPEANTVFSLNAVNQHGCEITENIEVEVQDLSVFINIEGEKDTIVEGESIQLYVEGLVENEDIIYQWAPEMFLNDPFSATPVATPDVTTNFIVGVQDENGCVGTATYEVVVIPSTCDQPYVFIPNSFSPNGDDINDVLFVNGQPIEEMRLSIFNRWGQKVFESFSKDQGWDGTFEGKQLPPDVFGYYLEVTCFNGEEYYKQGNITLLK